MFSISLQRDGHLRNYSIPRLLLTAGRCGPKLIAKSPVTACITIGTASNGPGQHSIGKSLN
jgi:hypothetical protein